MSIGSVETEIHDMIDQFVGETYYSQSIEWQDRVADHIYMLTVSAFHTALDNLSEIS